MATRSRRAAPAGDPTAPSTLRGAAGIAAWALAFWGGAQLAAGVLEQRPLALALVQAALAEWGAGHIGLAWSDPLSPSPSSSAIAKRAGIGAALGAGAGLAAIAAAAATKSAVVSLVAPGVGALALGLGAAMLAAVRDELLLRGAVLRATRGVLPSWAALLVCGAAAAAARLGIDGSFSLAIATDGLKAVALASLWVRDRGAWMAWGANTAWTWTLGAVARGGVVDVRFVAEPDTLASTMAVLAATCAVAGASIARRSARAGLR